MYTPSRNNTGTMESTTGYPRKDVYSGILPIGHQGCGTVHAIILNGQLAGKVIYLDYWQYPFFTYEKNFLDWYERWLDERLTGEPERGFGLLMNGTPEELLNIYLHAKEQKQQLNALQALKAKNHLPAEIISALQTIWNKEEETNPTLLSLLTKHNYEIAKPYLADYFTTDPSSVINYISWFAENKKEEWITPVLQRLINNTDPTFFKTAGYFLQSFDQQTTLKAYRQLAIHLQNQPTITPAKKIPGRKIRILQYNHRNHQPNTRRKPHPTKKQIRNPKEKMVSTFILHKANKMIIAIDVYYRENDAKSVGVLFHQWNDKEPAEVIESYTSNYGEYEPGAFYKRELPCILDLMEKTDLSRIKTILIDGYVYLDNNNKPGSGHHLYEALNKEIPVIGIAKKSFHHNQEIVKKVYRGQSISPLFITSVGIDPEQAATYIKNMAGEYRIPTLLKLVDTFTKQ